MMDKAHKALDLDHSLAIDGREGLDVNHLTRSRLQYLSEQSRSMEAQTRFADAKAGAIVTVVGLVTLRGVLHKTGGGIDPLLVAHLASATACFAVCLAVLMPRYNASRRRSASLGHEWFSWPALASGAISSDEYVHFARFSEASDLIASMARSNHALAAILRNKFRFLRLAMLFAALAILIAIARFYTSL